MFNRCQINRWKISRSFDQEIPLTSQLQEHLDRCEECRQYYTTNQSLLAHRDPSNPLAKNEARRQRIMQAVREDATEGSHDTVRILGAGLRNLAPPLLGTATVCLMLMWLFWSDESGPGTNITSEEPFQNLRQAAIFKSELSKIQQDLSRSFMFVRAAAQPMKIFDHE